MYKLTRLVLIIGMAVFFMFGCSVTQSKAEYVYDININLDGNNLEFIDQLPFIDSNIGCTYVPVRFMIEKIGGSVEWHGKTITVITSDGERIIKYSVGCDLVSVADIGEKSEHKGKWQVGRMEGEVLLINNRAMVPLKYFSRDMYGIKAYWDECRRTVYLISGHERMPILFASLQDHVKVIEKTPTPF